ncbi:unnamed protein product [Meganyctiphanes norvegica]|uniref:Uncharacterized protein n=1 Tax=Meganyctiphanes norvegica TaxID=48144 RepID=A0AAV2RVT1_MEGNR
MDGEEIGRSPGRLRRSTERSRENIREYVKLLGKRGSNASSPRGAKGSSPSSRSKIRSVLNAPANEKATTGKKGTKVTKSSPGSKQHSPEKVGKVTKNTPKARRKLSVDKKDEKKLINDKNIADEKLSRKKTTPGKKNVVKSPSATKKSKRINNSGSESEIEISLPDLNAINTSTDSFRGFASDDSQDEAKRNKISKLKEINAKVSKSKDDDDDDEQPPDLVLFLKEGRGRKKRYSEPPTLESEGISVPQKKGDKINSQSIDEIEIKDKLEESGNKKNSKITKKTTEDNISDLKVDISKRRSLRGQGLTENVSSNATNVNEKEKKPKQNKKQKTDLNNSLNEESSQNTSILNIKNEDSMELSQNKMTRSSSRGKIAGSKGHKRTTSAITGKVVHKLRTQRRNSLDSSTIMNKSTRNDDQKKLKVGITAEKQMTKKEKKKEKQNDSDLLKIENDSDSKAFKVENKEENIDIDNIEAKNREQSPSNIIVKEGLKLVPKTPPKLSSTPRKETESEYTKTPTGSKLESEIKGGDKLKSSTSPRKKTLNSLNTESESNELSTGEVNPISTNKLKGKSFSPEVRLIGKSLSESRAVKVILGPAGDKLVQAVPLSHLKGKMGKNSKESSPVMTFIMKKIDAKKSSLLNTVQNESKATTGEIRGIQKKDFKKVISPQKNAQGNKVPLEQNKNYNIHEELTPNDTSVVGSEAPEIMDFSDIGTSEIVLGENEKEKEELVGDLENTRNTADPKSVLGELDLMANESLGSSSEDNSRSEVPVEELLKSPESKVALDHSYSSGGSSEKSEPSSNYKKARIRPYIIDENASASKKTTEKEVNHKAKSSSKLDKSPIVQEFNSTDTISCNKFGNDSNAPSNNDNNLSSNSKTDTSLTTTTSISVGTTSTTDTVATTSTTTSNSTPSPQKKGPTPEKSPHSISRPVYSSVSLAKRSLDIMLHNDKINILRQMSQIFNNEKRAPAATEAVANPDADSQSSSDDDDDLEKGEKDESYVGAKVDTLNKIEKELTQSASASTSTDKIKRFSKSPVKASKFNQLVGKIVNESPVKNAISTLTQNTTFSLPRTNSTSLKSNVVVETNSTEVHHSDPPKLHEEKNSDISKEMPIFSEHLSNISNASKVSSDLENNKSIPSLTSNAITKPPTSMFNNKLEDNFVLGSKQSVTPRKFITNLTNAPEEKEMLNPSSKTAESLTYKEDIITDEKTISINDNEPSFTINDKDNINSEQKKKQEKESLNQLSLIKDIFDENSRSSHQSDFTEKNLSATEDVADRDENHPKVHHVPAYNVCLEEQIQVESTTTKTGEPVEIIDGFTFISFESEEGMAVYTRKEEKGGEAGWVHPRRRRRKRRRKKFLQITIGNVSATNSQSPLPGSPQVSSPVPQQKEQIEEEELVELSKYSAERERRLQLAELGAGLYPTAGFIGSQNERLDVETKNKEQPELPHNQKEENTNLTGEIKSTDNNVNKENLDQDNSEPPQLYEEVPAVDILYPRQKYKYYYNKELCKETKADARNVFVRRAGKLVPLNSVFQVSIKGDL